MPALHPSCYLNQNWKIPLHQPSSAPSVFYIRFTCNGHVPIRPRYRIKVGLGQNELEITTADSSDIADLAGPFLNPNHLSEAYAYIYYKSVDSGARTLFSHWYDLNINPDSILSSPLVGILNLNNKLFITDTGNSRLVELSATDLTFINSFGSSGSGNDQFSNPQGIYCDGTYLYITDTGNHRIIKRLAEDYSYISQIGSLGSGNDQFSSPAGITGDGTYLYITDTGNHRIVKRLASNLSYVSKIGSYGTGNDQFKSPCGIYCDGTYVYITDRLNHRIVKRSALDLSYIYKIGSLGTGNSNFNSPSGIWGDGTYLYITDTGNNRVVKRLASTLAYVAKYGSLGTDITRLNSPRGICGAGSTLFLLDSGNNRIVIKSASSLQSTLQSTDWDYATCLKQFEGSCDYVDDYTYIKTRFNYVPDSDCDLFIKRVLWKKFTTDLFTLTPSYEEINGTEYPVYLINFDELYRLSTTHSGKYNPTLQIPYTYYPPEPICDPSGWIDANPNAFLQADYINIESGNTTCDLVSYGDDDNDYYDWPWGGVPSLGGWFYWIEPDYVDYLISSLPVSAKIVIISDINGNSPSFTSFNRTFNRLFVNFLIGYNYGHLFCERTNMLIETFESYLHEMVLTDSATF